MIAFVWLCLNRDTLVLAFVNENCDGTLAEYTTVPQESMCAEMPESLSFLDAAGMPLAGMTSLQAMRHGRVDKNSVVVVRGAR